MARNSKVYGIEIPAVSNEFARVLAKNFPPLEVRPGVSHEELLHNAGQQEVVKFVNKWASGTIISGNPDDIRNTSSNTSSLLNKILGMFK